MVYGRKSVTESFWENVFPHKLVHLNCFTDSSVTQQFSALSQINKMYALFFTNSHKSKVTNEISLKQSFKTIEKNLGFYY